MEIIFNNVFVVFLVFVNDTVSFILSTAIISFCQCDLNFDHFKNPIIQVAFVHALTSLHFRSVLATA